MPMIRSIADLKCRCERQAARLARGGAAALIALALPLVVHAQFAGDPGTDLNQLNNNAQSSDGGAGASSGVDGSTGKISPTTKLHQSDIIREPHANEQPEPRSTVPEAAPGEFEKFVRAQAGGSVRRFGAELMTDASGSAVQDPLPAVPGDYIIRPGDEIAINIWGGVDADLRVTVDRAGRISIPRVGTITVAGVRNADLPDFLSRYVVKVFKNFQLAATLGQVRAIRIFVGGYAQRRGSVTVNGLSTVLHALMRAGGPSAAGSFRDIHLYRGGQEVAVFDLYDLLLKGRRNADMLVQPDDVLFIGPVGPQVAMLGSVNEPALYELKPGEVLGDVLRMSGGFTAVADRSRVAIERLADRKTGHVTELELPASISAPLATGDVIRSFSVVAATLPLQIQNQRVRVQGEVNNPGDFILPPGSRMEDALRAAGGMTASAYPFGAVFSRESVRATQQLNYERALNDLETAMEKSVASLSTASIQDTAGQAAAQSSNARLLQRLRSLSPTGRIVLDVEPNATTMPNLPLEDGDVLTIPGRGTSVGVFGSVFNTGNFVYSPGRSMDQYLAKAGGPTRGADRDSIFMVRADGSVVSALQGATFWHSSSTFHDTVILPGDTIFVPDEINRSTLVQNAKDWTQILYQFGLGVAGIKTLGL